MRKHTSISLYTPVCDLLGCAVPILLAGMGGVARSELVVAVTNAGGFGFLGMVRESPALITEEIAKARDGTPRDFGVNLIPAATRPDLLEEELSACIAAKVPVMALFWDLSIDVVKRLRDAGILVVCQIGSAKEAEQAQAAGAQILIAQGIEAGGHVRGTVPRHDLLQQVLAVTDLPVIAAGGLVDGVDLARALRAGAQGGLFGTAFLATNESFAHDFHKQRVVETAAGTTVRTDAFHVNWPRGAHVRVLANSVTRGKHGDPFSGVRKAIGRDNERTIWLFSTDSPLKSMSGDFEAMALYAGEGVGGIRSIIPAKDRLNEIRLEAEGILMADPGRQPTAPSELSSPVCYGREAGDTYQGYATREELVDFLNTLLEAERAGARVAARTAAEVDDSKSKALLASIHRDEAHWCAMLLKWISFLNGVPSPRTGDFYERCMAIKGIKDRLSFLNRGQGWVVRQLREMLPKIGDDAMYADCNMMLRSHEQNIARTNESLG